jgi:hypothetical protein
MWMNPSSGKRRIYVRISVRALMVLVLCAGGWMGWLVRSPSYCPRRTGAVTDRPIASKTWGNSASRYRRISRAKL